MTESITDITENIQLDEDPTDQDALMKDLLLERRLMESEELAVRMALSTFTTKV